MGHTGFGAKRNESRNMYSGLKAVELVGWPYQRQAVRTEAGRGAMDGPRGLDGRIRCAAVKFKTRRRFIEEMIADRILGLLGGVGGLTPRVPNDEKREGVGLALRSR